MLNTGVLCLDFSHKITKYCHKAVENRDHKSFFKFKLSDLHNKKYALIRQTINYCHAKRVHITMNKKSTPIFVIFFFAASVAAYIIISNHNKSPVDSMSDSNSAGKKNSAISLSLKGHNDIAGKRESIIDQQQKEYDRNSKRNVRQHPLDCPAAFVKKGVYFWCDPDGLWSIFWKDGGEVLVEIEMVADDKFEIIKKSKGFETQASNNDNEIKISNNMNFDKGVIQFKVKGSKIQCNVLFDNQPMLKKIFIGSLLTNPENVKFKIHNRNHITEHLTGSLDEKNGVSFTKESGGGSKKGATDDGVRK